MSSVFHFSHVSCWYACRSAHLSSSVAPRPVIAEKRRLQRSNDPGVDEDEPAEEVEGSLLAMLEQDLVVEITGRDLGRARFVAPAVAPVFSRGRRVAVRGRKGASNAPAPHLRNWTLAISLPDASHARFSHPSRLYVRASPFCMPACLFN